MSTHTAQGLAAILEKRPDDVVITFAKRTATGKYRKGQFKDSPVDEMMQALYKATIKETGLDPRIIEDICVGTCHPPSPTYASRAAALAAGIPHQVPVSTVNRLCASGLMAIRNIAHAIKSKEISLGVAVGVENMTLNPRPTPIVAEEVDNNPQAHDCIQVWPQSLTALRVLTLPELQPMGWTAEMVAQTYKVSRTKQDEYALISHTRASPEEIIPIEIRGSVISVDDTIRPGVTIESLTALKPVFPDWGENTTTAGNASGIGDGAALCILTTRERARAEGMEILGKWVGCAVVGVEPRYMGIGPIAAIPKVLSQFGLSKEDVDVYEINEAFASQFAYCVEKLEIPISKINPKYDFRIRLSHCYLSNPHSGGAIAVTHPLGMTGVRQVVTGLAEVRRRNEKILCTSMCVGSGMGAAGIFVNEAQPLHSAKL
ncbi:3-ketoacyl-CoA thiolase [Lanmaoa asiatica]|nr:3-ketoacyl-CoA thiolase [Lanmaoa asiatica]